MNSLDFYESFSIGAWHQWDVPGSAMQHELFDRVVVSAAVGLDDKVFVQVLHVLILRADVVVPNIYF